MLASKRKVKINVPNGGYVLITGHIATTLGFEQDTVIEKETISPYVADVNGGLSSLYVYTDIVDANLLVKLKCHFSGLSTPREIMVTT